MQLELQPAFRAGADPASVWSSEILNTQAVIVASRGICDRASARLLARSRGPTETTDSARSLRRALICNRLSATRIPGTHILEIAYRDEDPKRSLWAVTEVAEAYLEHVSSLSDRELQQLARLKGELDSREADLVENQRLMVRNALAQGVADPAARREALADQLKSYDEALTAVRISRIRSAARVSSLAQVSSGVRATSERSEGPEQGTVTPSVQAKQLADAKTDLKAAELEEAELQRTLERTNAQAISFLEQEPEEERLDRSRRIYTALHAAALRRIEEAAGVAGAPLRARVLTSAHLVAEQLPTRTKWLIPVVPLLGAIYASAQLWGRRRAASNRSDSGARGKQQRADARLSEEVSRA